MEKPKKINPSAVVPLKQALASVYWYKDNFRTFLTSTLKNPSILSRLNWDDIKFRIADTLISLLLEQGEKGQTEILRLCEALTDMRDFSHLEDVEDGKERIEKAKKSVEALRKYTEGHYSIKEEEENSRINREKYLEKLKNDSEFKRILNTIKNKFIALSISEDKQKRGYELEIVLKDLFELFDLAPKASFKIQGEQIDGAFTFDYIDFILEAKWQKDLIGAKELDALAGKVRRKIDNTLGLFLAINGFSKYGLAAHSASGRHLILLMDGADLMAVLEGRIDLHKLLKRKKREAAQSGNIYLRYKDMI